MKDVVTIRVPLAFSKRDAQQSDALWDEMVETMVANMADSIRSEIHRVVAEKGWR